jgi:hypothetical protein
MPAAGTSAAPRGSNAGAVASVFSASRRSLMCPFSTTIRPMSGYGRGESARPAPPSARVDPKLSSI